MLAVLLLVAFALRVRQIGHPAVKDLDEAYHAVVARNLIEHPLKPMLYERPFAPYDHRNWQSNHVWLHKPPVALWQMALSMNLLGEANWTMRLPSVLLSTGAVALTFLIGRRLADDRAGLVAALLQALSPAITRLVQGQVFSDHVDVAMLFYSELGVLLLIRAARSGLAFDAAVAGIVQAVAWMTKSYPALFIAGLAVVLCIGGRWAAGECRLRLSPRQLVVFVAAALVSGAPWVIWCATQYPAEFAYEQLHVFMHLYTDVEQFAAPWDRLLADYLQRGLLAWWGLAIVATLSLAVDGWRHRDLGRLCVAAWAIGVLVPHMLATSKTPTATLVAWPAFWIAIGVVVAEALRGRRFALGTCVAAALLLAIWPQWPAASVMGYGEDYFFGRIALQRWPLFVGAAAIGLGGLLASRIPTALSSRAAAMLLATVFAWPVARDFRLAVATSGDMPTRYVAFPGLAKVVRNRLPANAVFFVDVQTRGEVILAMWWLDRTCYALNESGIAGDARAVTEAGGMPMILSRRDRDWPVVVAVPGEGTIYRLP